MIVCPNCGKENQDHYKFCLGCGAKLPAPGQAQAPSPPPPAAAPPAPSVPPPAVVPPPEPQQPPQSYGAPASAPGPYGQPQQGTYGAPPAPGSAPYGPAGQGQARAPSPSGAPAQAPGYGHQQQPGPTPGGGPRPCPSCQTPNPSQFKFCGACGSPLEAAASSSPSPQPPAPQPPPPPMAPPSPQPNTAVGPAPAPSDEVAAKTMFMDASQRPAMAGGVATIRLVLLREDGTEGGVLVIEGGPETIGRSHGPPFDSDAYLSSDHAELTAAPEGVAVDDLGSLNGVYLKLEGRAELQHRDFFRVGQELLLYEDLPEPTPTADGTERMGSPNPGYWGRVSVMVSPDRVAAAYPIKEGGIDIGREDGDVTFPEDGYVSGSHCRIIGDDEGVFLEDLGSSNGTYMRVRKGQLVRPGTMVLIGQQLFRVELG